MGRKCGVVKSSNVSLGLCEERAKVFKALAHPTRVVLAEALMEGELCVQDLTDVAGLSISTVSRHLNLMREAGLLASRKQGLNQFYSLRCDCLGAFFCCVDGVIQDYQAERQIG